MKKLTTALSAAALLVALTGCDALASLPIPGAAAPAKPANYGSVVGNGQIVTVADGTYERIALSPYLVGEMGPADTADETFTAEQKLTARNLVMKFTAEEFVDSSLLEGGEAAVPAWVANEGVKYRAGDWEKVLVLGNVDDHNVFPPMIHDGKPRVSDVSLNPTQSGSSNLDGVKFLSYAVEYTVNYRLTDKSAVQVTALAEEMGIDEFLSSGRAKDTIKDNEGENALKVSGKIDYELVAQPDGQMKISNIHYSADFDTDVFVNEPAAP